MRSTQFILVFLAIACPATRAATQSPVPALPAIDPVIQGWVKAISQKPTSANYESQVTALLQADAAKNGKRLTDEGWLAQVMHYAMSLPDADARWRAEMNLMWHSQGNVRVDIVPRLRYLSVQLDSADPNVARVADELIRASFAAYSGTTFDTMGNYLRGLRGGEPSWKLVRRMYEIDPDAALKTAAEEYITGAGPRRQSDRVTHLKLERDRKEVAYLLLSWELAPEDKKPAWSEKALAKLMALAAHPHWMVRGYVAGVLRRELTKPGSDNTWLADPVLLKQLREDTNPFVAGMAKEIEAR